MRVYYNEFDAEMADWLRVLIEFGLIPDGDVDERSIVDVQPQDLKGYMQCHFFAGLGGWSLALRLAGWPDDRPVWTGSCPCQPFSTAGKRQGQADERHLWPHFHRLIRERRPESVFGEQVASAIGHGWLDGISADLEAEGYAVGAIVLGAHSVGAPHIRQRLYWHGRLCQPDGAGRDAVVCSGQIVGHGRSSGPDGGPGRPSDASIDPGQRGAGAVLAAEAGLGGAGQQHGHLSERPSDGIEVGGPSDSERHAGEPGRVADQSGEGIAEVAAGASDEPRRHGGPGRPSDSAAGGLGEPGRVAADAGRPASEAGGAGFWSDYDILPYRDGKSRRIESQPCRMADGAALVLAACRAAGLTEAEEREVLSTFPLAQGFPGRRMLLKGIGNMICIPLAASFVAAAREG